MKSPLHILHLEDDPDDAALVKSTLAAGGITWPRAKGKAGSVFIGVNAHRLPLRSESLAIFAKHLADCGQCIPTDWLGYGWFIEANTGRNAKNLYYP